MTDTTTDVTDGHDAADADDSSTTEISPSVRRLLRQYDVDVRTIRGTGPNGRIRPGDVLAIVGNPSLTQHPANAEMAGRGNTVQSGPGRGAVPARTPGVGTGAAGSIGTTVFVCNLSRVLAHRNRSSRRDLSIACYVASAALELVAGSKLLEDRDSADVRLVLHGATTDATAILTAGVAGSPEEIHESLQIDAPTRRGRYGLTIRHYGLPGHIVDICPPAADDELAVLCIGGLQRTIGLAMTDGTQTPRVVTQCQLALAYRADAIDAGNAARFVAECVRALEAWPVPHTAPAQG
jgi:pyruvate/2-oxoglutarate dehydrogenase complex dihydrolipoamide acyltransferase (E2) component